MDKKKKIIFISLGAVAVIAIVVLTICFFNVTSDLKKSEKENQEFEELIALEKEETLNDLHDLKIKFEEEQKKVVSTDSLFHKLEQERIHAQALYDELQSTKATSAAEIKRLKKELSTLREVLKEYSKKIDELYQENSELKEENKSLKNEKKKVEKEKKELEKEKKNLEEKVDIAAQLDATNISMVMLRSNGKETDNVKRAKQIRISCTISRNVTAETGHKMAYVRITKPDGEVLTKDMTRDVFKFQNRDMAYSICKEFEFASEKLNLDFFWNIEETLQKGRYHVAIIVDGNIIGEEVADFK